MRRLVSLAVLITCCGLASARSRSRPRPSPAPPPALAVLTKDRILLARPVKFAIAKAIIDRTAFELLDAVVALLVAQPALQLEIQGHDGEPDQEYRARRLSADRADAIRRYLIAKGIAADRLQSRSYGDNVPLVSPRTAAGRRKNNRIELVVLPPPAPAPTPTPAASPAAAAPPPPARVAPGR
ncbi:MAG: OmpA family protein [Deltaproteobacteria bacterium]|nr:OmpA family protein [Deltaproteobacteria bacterium]